MLRHKLILQLWLEFCKCSVNSFYGNATLFDYIKFSIVVSRRNCIGWVGSCGRYLMVNNDQPGLVGNRLAYPALNIGRSGGVDDVLDLDVGDVKVAFAI